MADNFVANPGVGGDTFAADDIGGIKYVRSKLIHGADGVNAGDVSSANPLPVTLGGTQAVSGTVTLDAATLAALESITVVDGGGSLTVDGTVAATNTTLESLVLAEDAVHASGDKGIMALGVRNDAGTVMSADGDYHPLSINGNGALRVTAGNVTVVGAGAHDSVVTGNPISVGLVARTADQTAVSDSDTTRAAADTLGKQLVLIGSAHDQHVRGTANFTNTTAADIIAAAGAGRRIAVTSILVVNGHATVGTKVEIRDGTTVRMQGYAAPLGGGWAMSAGGPPLMISTANTAITARNVTTGSDVDVTISGYTIGN